MARRFGGRYSPDADRTLPVAAQGPRPYPAGARVNLLFVAPFPFAISAFFQPPGTLALLLVAFAVMMLSAWLTREGVLAQAAYDGRKIARKPAIPRKFFGSVLLGLGLALAALPSGVVSAAILGALAFGLHLASFGLDPMVDKGLEGVDAFATDRVTRALEDAETTLGEMAEAIRQTGDRHLAERVARFSAQCRQLFDTVENDPRRLNGARRYLGIYLTGARDATVKFAELHARNRDTDARAEYEALLDDLDSRFALRREALLADDRTALDIEIEVLRERLAREGLRRTE
ncbi:MAG: 5-bromo-4-chloroindolyl phosphate hydrolysis family protein [Roseinatronobacter sp.]